jgi:hypothetical protein
MTLAINKQLDLAGQGVKFFDDPVTFGLWLADLHGDQFMTYEAVYDLDKRMNKTKRGAPSRGPGAIKNPYLGQGLRKYAVTQTVVCFDYDRKRELRGVPEPERKGNWIQAVVVNNRVTPLAVHKGDVVTTLKDGIDAASPEAGAIANLRAVLNDQGTIQFLVDNPRLFLRYEIQRQPGEGERHERKLRSKSIILRPDGTEVSKADLADYLKPSDDEREIDYGVTSLDGVLRVSISKTLWQRRDFAGVACGGTTYPSVRDLIAAKRPATAEAEADAEAKGKKLRPATDHYLDAKDRELRVSDADGDE